MKDRADNVLVEKGLVASREKAKALIMAGLVYSGEERILKPGQAIAPGAPLRVKSGLPYVSRGGLKLAEALDRLGLDVKGYIVIDIGSSTGGFADCLLQRGAARIYTVDVDTKQLDDKLRRSERVVPVEKNARYLEPRDIADVPDLMTMDVSFISITKILPALARFPGKWEIVSLVKPQFEAGRGQVGKKGVVRDPAVHESVLKTVIAGAAGLGFRLQGLMKCSTRGQKGNIEFFGRWSRTVEPPDEESESRMIKEAVYEERV